jgi:hypothetical protein
MSETNGQNESRLDRIEASHIKLMAEMDVLWTRHLEVVAEQDRKWEQHNAFVAEQDRASERQKERDKLLDERIEKLVSGIGAFIAEKGGKAA